MNTQISW